MFKQPKKMVIVHHKEIDQSFEGVWIGNFKDHYELEAVTMLLPNDVRRKLDTHILIPKDKVSFLQVMAIDAT